MMILVGTSLLSHAQPGAPAREEKMEKFKIAFITERLDLTVEEAQKFWPVYNQFNKELKEFRKNRRPDEKMETTLLNMSDADAEKMADGEIANRQKELDVMKKYHSQFKQVLPIKKVAILYLLEKEFHRELLQKIRERGGDDKPPRPRR